MSSLYKIFVTNVITPDNLFAQIGTEESFQYFAELEENCHSYGLQLHISGSGVLSDGTECVEGQWVIAMSQTLHKWARAKITMITDEQIDVNFVDYQVTELLDRDQILYDIPDWVHETTPIAYKCKLYGIKPLTKSWISRASSFLISQVQCQLLDTQVVPAEGNGPLQVDIIVPDQEDDTKYLSVSDLLKEEGLAMDIQPSAQLTSLEIPSGEEKPNSSLKQNDPSNVGSPGVPAFDINMLAMRHVKKDQQPASSIPPDDIEQDIFTKGLGQEYEQFQDHKITAIPGSDTNPNGYTSSFSEVDIAQQLREMKQANEMADIARDRMKVARPHSPAVKPTNEKRTGMGRGVPPPFVQQNISDNAMHSSMKPRQNSCSPAPRHIRESTSSSSSARQSPYRDSPPAGGGAGRQIRDSPNSQSRTAARQDSPAGNRDKRGKKRAIRNLTDEQLKNEYEWQVDQLQFKIRQTLLKVTEGVINRENGERNLKKLVYPANSHLKELGKKEELEVCIETLCCKAIEDSSTDIVTAINLIYTFHDDGQFNNNLSQVLYGLQKQYIKKYETNADKRSAEGYSKLLALMYLQRAGWEDSTVNSCVFSTVDKWAGVNIKYIVKNKELMEVYIDCLTHFLMAAGAEMEKSSPHLLNLVFVDIQKKAKDKEISKAIRDKLWNLILLRDEGRWRKATTPTRSKEDNLTVIKDEKDLNKSDESKLHAVARNDKLMKMMDDQQFGKRRRSGEKSQKSPPNANIRQPEIKNWEDNHQGVINVSDVENALHNVNSHSTTRNELLTDEFKNKIGVQLPDLPPDFSKTQEDFDMNEAQPPQVTRQHNGRIQIYEEEEQIQRSSDNQQGRSSVKKRVAKLMLDKSVQVERTVEAKYVQTDGDSQSSPAVAVNSQSSISQGRSRRQDKYNRVRYMLLELELEEYMPAFVEQGIRDTVLDLEFSEVKDLLKDCGVKAGQILEIKDYLKKKPKTADLYITQFEGESCSSPSVYSDTVDSFPAFTQPEPVIASMDYQEPILSSFNRQYSHSSVLNYANVNNQPQKSDEVKTLFSPQDFLEGIPTNADLYRQDRTISTEKVDNESNIHLRQNNSNRNTIANAAARLPQISPEPANKSPIEPVRPPPGFESKSQQPCYKLNDNFKERKARSSSQDGIDASNVNTRNDIGLTTEQLKKDDCNPNLSHEESYQGEHPRTRNNLAGVKSVSGDWLKPGDASDNNQLETSNQSTDYNSGTYDYFENRPAQIRATSATNSRQYNDTIRKTKVSCNNNNIDNNVTSPSSYMPPSPGDETSVSGLDDFPSFHIVASKMGSSPLAAVEVTSNTKQSSAWQQRQNNELISNATKASLASEAVGGGDVDRTDPNFPSLTEAEVILSSSGNSGDHPALQSQDNYIESYRARKNIPRPDVVKEKITMFGSYPAICCICGVRGMHKTQECPDYSSEKLFI